MIPRVPPYNYTQQLVGLRTNVDVTIVVRRDEVVDKSRRKAFAQNAYFCFMVSAIERT